MSFTGEQEHIPRRREGQEGEYALLTTDSVDNKFSLLVTWMLMLTLSEEQNSPKQISPSDSPALVMSFSAREVCMLHSNGSASHRLMVIMKGKTVLPVMLTHQEDWQEDSADILSFLWLQDRPERHEESRDAAF